MAVSALAWIGLGVSHFSNHDGGTERFEFNVLAWTAMVLAMMLPGILPMVRDIAFNSLWSRRHRSTALFTTAYVAMWVAFGLVGWAAIAVAQRWIGASLTTNTALVAASVMAVGWQFTSIKFRALRRCHLRKPLASRGLAADRSALRYGTFHARACVESCWALMTVMLIAHDFHLMVPLAAVTIAERYQTRPTTAPGAAAIAVAVLIAVV